MDTAHESAEPGSGRWEERLQEEANRLGWRVRFGRGPLADAVRDASASLPLLCPLGGDDASDAFLVITGSTRRRICVGLGQGQWHRPAEVARMAGVGSLEESVSWARVEPLLTGMAAEGDEGHGHGHGPHAGSEVSPLRRLGRIFQGDRDDVRTVLIYALAIGLLTVATPLAVDALVGTVAMSLMPQQLVVLSVMLLGCLGLAAAFRAVQTYVVEVIQRRLFVRVARELAYRLPRVRLDAYDGGYGPELVNRFFDVLTVQKVGALLLLDGLGILVQTLIGLALLAFFHAYLLGFGVGVVVVLTGVVVLLGRGAVGSSVRESRAKYALAAQLEELARVPLSYKGPAAAGMALARSDQLMHRYLTARSLHFRVVFRQVLFALGFQAIASAALLGLGGWLVIEEQLTLGQLVAAELIVAMVAGSFAKLGKHLESWYDLLAAVEKLGHLLDLPLERTDGEKTDAPSTEGLALRLHHVHFGYRHDRPVLNGLDLDITEGERVAIVGPSGSGKSTLVELLYGLRSPDEGWIALSGWNLRDLRLDAIRKLVAVVKGPDVVTGTVLDNVRMGRAEITAVEIREALERVGLLGVLSALPDGLHTTLSASGAPLSQGQIRRLLLARAMVGKPRLLILDETLDTLDIDARRHVFRTLFDRRNPWTLVIVTHDEEIARSCDQVVVLANGRVHPANAAEANHRVLADWLEGV